MSEDGQTPQSPSPDTAEQQLAEAAKAVQFVVLPFACTNEKARRSAWVSSAGSPRS